MKILVTVTRVPDPEQRVKISNDKLDLENATFALNPFDEYAVETALRLTEKDAARTGEVVVLTVGPKDTTQQVRGCLAMGADRAIRVDADPSTLDSEQVARVIESICKRENPDLVLMGKQAVDGDCNQVGQLVAGYLGRPQACFACEIEAAPDESTLTVGREVDGGTEYKRIPLPAVVTVDLRIVLPSAVKAAHGAKEYPEGCPRYASLRGIMQAKKKKIEELSAADLGVELSPWVRTLKITAPPERQAGVKVDNVDALIDKLQNEAKAL